MTDTTRPPAVNNNILIVAATVVVVVTIAAIVVTAVAIEDGARATSMIVLVGAPLTTLIGFLGLFVTVQGIKTQLGAVAQQTTELTNGVGDSKIRAAVADVLRPELIDPDMHPQLEADRQKRAAKEAAAELLMPHLTDPTNGEERP